MQCSECQVHDHRGIEPVSILKWGASAIQIAAYAATASGWSPWNIYLFLIGIAGWLSVGILWKDRAIILIRLVAMVAMIAGVLGGA